MIAAINVLKGLVIGAEANHERFPGAGGVTRPRDDILSYLSLGPTLYAQIVAELKTLAGGGLIQLPSSYEDLLTPGVAESVTRYIRSPGTPAEQREAVQARLGCGGLEFAGRHDQYERFYLGLRRAAGGAARAGNPEVCEALADAALASYAPRTPSRERTSRWNSAPARGTAWSASAPLRATGSSPAARLTERGSHAATRLPADLGHQAGNGLSG